MAYVLLTGWGGLGGSTAGGQEGVPNGGGELVESKVERHL